MEVTNEKRAARQKELETRLDELIADTEFHKKFEQLQTLMHLIAVHKGWWEPAKSIGEQLLMMHSEISEATEEARKPTNIGMDYFYYNTPIDNNDGKLHLPINLQTINLQNDEHKPEGFAIELADCVIREMDTLSYYGASLILSILLKTKYNLTRSQRHGGKLI